MKLRELKAPVPSQIGQRRYVMRQRLRLFSSAWLRPVGIGLCWLMGCGFFAWAAWDWLGAPGAKVVVGAVLLGLGGLAPLRRILGGGLALYPPTDWLSNRDRSER